jgi:hypothetical protein
MVTNNLFSPFRDLRIENAEWSSKGSSTTTSETNDSLDKGRPPPTVLTSEANLISLQREQKSIMTGELFFQKTAAGTQITTNCIWIKKTYKNS